MIKGKYETVVTPQCHITGYKQICVNNMTRNHNQLNLKIFNYPQTPLMWEPPALGLPFTQQ